LESYKGPITRSKSKQLQFPEVGETSRTETRRTLIMGDREERNEVPENQEERQRVPRRRRLELVLLICKGNNIHYQPFPKEFYQFSQEMEA
jgi:hypothetical protein